MTELAGTWALVRLALRRDRIMIPAWLFGIGALVLGTAASFAKLGQAERERLGSSISDQPILRGLYGPPYDVATVGGATAWRVGSGAAALLAGLMSILLVVRHTRSDEESGRSELIGSTAVGRYAGHAAALVVVAFANAGLAALTTLGLAAFGQSVVGSLALGLAIGVSGCVFGAVASLTAQLASTARAAGGWAGAVLAAAYLVRMVANMSTAGAVWASPLGWAQEVRSFAGNRWTVLLLPLALTVVLVTASAAIATRRDIGAGVFAVRAGPASAASSLRGTWTLAWRVHRALLLGWLVGVVAGGALVGAVAHDLRSLLEDTPQIADIVRRAGGAQDAVDAYLFGMLGLLALAAAGFAIQVVLRLRAEETSGIAEPLLAAPVSRQAWSLPHLGVAMFGSAGLLLAAGAAMGAADGLRTDELWRRVSQLVEMAIGQVPAVWTLAALAFALAGMLPRWSALAWAGLAICILLGQLGSGLALPDWLTNLSPFTHAPQQPFDGGSGALFVTLVAVVLLALVGLAGIRRRDLST